MKGVYLLKKKIFVAVAAVLLIALCVPFAAMAASPQADTTGAVAGSSVVPHNANLVVAAASPAAASSLQGYAAANYAGSKWLGAQDISMVDATTGAAVQPDGNTRIYVACPGLYTNGNVVVLHQKADGSIEPIQATCQDGGFTFHTSSMSPFAYILLSAGSAPTGGGGTTATSPRTGVYA